MGYSKIIQPNFSAMSNKPKPKRWPQQPQTPVKATEAKASPSLDNVEFTSEIETPDLSPYMEKISTILTDYIEHSSEDVDEAAAAASAAPKKRTRRKSKP